MTIFVHKLAEMLITLNEKNDGEHNFNELKF